MEDIRREVVRQGIVASIGKTTIWRWLSEDAIQPWRHRSWIFPRDPQFSEKAGRILDLYEGIWEGKALQDGDFVVSTDEKTSIQARRRKHAIVEAAPGRSMKVEHEYERCGSFAYLAVWDVRRAKVFGRCEEKTGIAPFGLLVNDVMKKEPYRSARRVFWIMDNGSSHRGERCIRRLTKEWKNIVVVHTPVHASWLNQVEIYFSILQRKVLQPNYFESVSEGSNRVLEFQEYYEKAAKPFEWKFTRKNLEDLLVRLTEKQAA